MAARAGELSLLDVTDLTVDFRSQEGVVHAVDHVSFALEPGELVGLVGESGCGPYTTTDYRDSQGREDLMIFQDPVTSLNPVLTIERQMTEGIEIHLGLVPRRGRKRSIEMLKLVGIPTAASGSHPRLPAPVLGRDAPARHDRHRPLLQPQAADRRRAHHGPRRDDPGADPAPDEEAVPEGTYAPSS